MSEPTLVEEPIVDEPIVVVQKQNRQRSKSRRKKQPPYAVIVHNDDLHTFPYVIEVLQRVCGHDLQKAWLLTNQVHHRGRAIAWSGVREVAELKRDQIRGFGPDHYASRTVRFPLGVTIEPLPGE